MRICVWTFQGRVWGPMGTQVASNRGFLAPRGVWGLFYLSLSKPIGPSLVSLLSLLSPREAHLSQPQNVTTAEKSLTAAAGSAAVTC